MLVERFMLQTDAAIPLSGVSYSPCPDRHTARVSKEPLVRTLFTTTHCVDQYYLLHYCNTIKSHAIDYFLRLS
jgi:hypothetical protein